MSLHMIPNHHTAVIADDEPFMREALREQLQMLWPDLDIVAEAADGPDALRALTLHKPSFAFLDIRMPGLSGLQVAQLVEGQTKVVFVTAYDNHAVQAFEARAIDYVLKPLDPSRMAKMVARLQSIDNTHSSQQHDALRSVAAVTQPSNVSALEWLHVSVGQQVRLTHVDDVMFFESDTKYTRVVSAEVDGLIRASLKELLEKLPDAFVQIHRSAVVNRRHVRAIHRIDDNVELEIKNHASRLRVSEANRHLFKAM
jgi:DNA-binding LytR/AlgR family response regulator